MCRDEHTIKAEAIREAVAAQRQLARDSATRDGRYEHEEVADWLDEYAEAMDSAIQTSDNDAVDPAHDQEEATRCAS
ncbi:hypothetical protein [Kribbella sp. NPDC048928]|uniref:hypothetical protein n=1 Tax=Kribbella sp. NPDC048928 TaxID=3364111 RepID=UPI00371F3596